MTDKQNRVAILLSTFNGERFLSEQLDSLLAQSYAGCHIWVRDDGSSDATLAILQQYSDLIPTIRVVSGENLGFVRSFFELLEVAGSDYEFYFFCDQDDVWQVDKVACAVRALKELEGPGLYCSRTEYVDAGLQFIGPSPDYPQGKIGWGNALVQNIATGCTIALNAASRQLMLSARPRYCLAHDWWAYLLVSALGQIVFDSKTHILYRQHGRNTIGMEQQGLRGQWARVQRFVRRLRQAERGWLDQLAEFDRMYGGKLTAQQRDELQLLLRSRAGWSGALKVASKKFYWRMSTIDTWILKVLLVLRLY